MIENPKLTPKSVGPVSPTILGAIELEVGKVTLKSNGDEALNNEFLFKSNGDEALSDGFP